MLIRELAQIKRPRRERRLLKIGTFIKTSDTMFKNVKNDTQNKFKHFTRLKIKLSTEDVR